MTEYLCQLIESINARTKVLAYNYSFLPIPESKKKALQTEIDSVTNRLKKIELLIENLITSKKNK